MQLIITRPEADALPLKAKLESMGHTAYLAPLLKIVPRPGVYIPSLAYQLVCATSANALRSLYPADEIKNIELLTVGPQSLSAAREEGFKFCQAHGGDAQGLAAHITANFVPKNGPILYLSGAETASNFRALLKASGFSVERVIIYDAVIQTPPEIDRALEKANGVLLYSPRSARIWCDFMVKSKLEKQAASPTYYCLSDNVAKILPMPWQKRVAKTPDEAAMLALLD
jgi:uroporphyrinogen-III synthase